MTIYFNKERNQLYLAINKTNHVPIPEHAEITTFHSNVLGEVSLTSTEYQTVIGFIKKLFKEREERECIKSQIITCRQEIKNLEDKLAQMFMPDKPPQEFSEEPPYANPHIFQR